MKEMSLEHSGAMARQAVADKIETLMKQVDRITVEVREVAPGNHAYYRLNAAWHNLKEARDLL